MTLVKTLVFVILEITSTLHILNFANCYKENTMEADNAPKWWHAVICKIESKRAEIMHINIDNTLNGGENTRSGENTHTYPTIHIYTL